MYSIPARRIQWSMSGGISDLRTAQSSMRRGLAYSTHRVSRASIVMLGACRRHLRGLRSRGPMPANRHLSRPDIVKSGASRRRHALPRLALQRRDRSIDLHHQPVLWFGRLERRCSFYGHRFCRSLDQFDRAASLSFKRGLDVLDHGLKLLVRQLLDRIAVLDFVLAPD